MFPTVPNTTSIGLTIIWINLAIFFTGPFKYIIIISWISCYFGGIEINSGTCSRIDKTYPSFHINSVTWNLLSPSLLVTIGSIKAVRAKICNGSLVICVKQKQSSVIQGKVRNHVYSLTVGHKMRMAVQWRI